MDVAAALIGMVLMTLVFLVEELWMRLEPTDPPRPDALTNRFLEQRWRYECPCGKTMITYNLYVVSYRCLSCRITRVTRTHTIQRMLDCLGFANQQTDCVQNAATPVVVISDVIEER